MQFCIETTTPSGESYWRIIILAQIVS
jgi:hypothetical protein